MLTAWVLAAAADATVPLCRLPFEEAPADRTFEDAGLIGEVSMGIAWDGAWLWTASGGSSSGKRLSKYTTDGVWVADAVPSRDLRAIFTRGDGASEVHERQYNSRTIHRAVGDTGLLWTTVVTLDGGTLDTQSSVLWDAHGGEWVGMAYGFVQRWDEAGSWLGTIALSGFGTVGGEASSPTNARLATSGGCFLTYTNGQLSAWNKDGVREATALLTDAGTTSDSVYSFSYALGHVWVIDQAYGTWRGWWVGEVGCDDADGDDHHDVTCGGDDCNDVLATAYPGALEACNGVDDDCDGSIDEGVDCCEDIDHDGFDATWCGGDDCDDGDDTVWPGAPEACDGIDNDCDFAADDGLAERVWYRDQDGDGYGGPSATIEACAAPEGYVDNDADCDDARPSVHPFADEVCNARDDDCDGRVDTEDPDYDPGSGSVWYPDADADGYGDPAGAYTACDGSAGAVSAAGDCDDLDPTVNPGAAEVCNGRDDDCDSQIDDEDPEVDPATFGTWGEDGDRDGYGDPTLLLSSCDPLPGWTGDLGDCDDADPTVHPGAPEVCDGHDDDCDGYVDDADPDVDLSTGVTGYVDADGDGHGDDGRPVDACALPDGSVADGGDCDDADPTVHPGAGEACGGADEDCDGLVDDADPDVDPTTFTPAWTDADGDGHGDPEADAAACAPDAGAASSPTDCDDGAADVHPGAAEVCNGIDDDCDGAADDADHDLTGDVPTWFADGDGDGYGDPSVSRIVCDPGTGFVADATDCDDTDRLVRPDATEACNDLDDDCDALIDEAITYVTWWADGDGDGYGDPRVSRVDCAPGEGFLDNADDCDDADPLVHPAAIERCGGGDQDCDGLHDEADPSWDPTSGAAWPIDADGDGYGHPTDTAVACAAPEGTAGTTDDCDDSDGSVHPDAVETCDGTDQDCDGGVDEDADGAPSWSSDEDGDGFGDPVDTVRSCEAPDGFLADATDCDPSQGTVYPGAPEIPYDGVDQDCDGSDTTDHDGDGVEAAVAGGADCHDGDPEVHPGSSEVADGVDQDCDGVVDEGTEASDDDHDGFAEWGGDCDDAEGTVSPAATERCDGRDEDCDGAVDEGTTCSDDDGDGFAESGGDCGDHDPAVHPGAIEVADNGVDDNCDGTIDAGHLDADGDGYAVGGGDCDDGRSDVHPGAVERPDGSDDDCDGFVDENTTAFDDDGDGASEDDGDCDDGDPTTGPLADEVLGNFRDDDCDGSVDEGTSGFDDDGDGVSEWGGDCDDEDAAVYPGAPEAENGADDDCDGQADEHLWDLDGDGHAAEAGDCDDLDRWVHPGAPEACDRVDNDCDGGVDEGCDADTDPRPIDTGATPPTGCGCASGAEPAGWLAVLLASAAAAARRRGAPRLGQKVTYQ